MLNIFVSKEKREAEKKIESMLSYANMVQADANRFYAEYAEMKREIKKYSDERMISWKKENDSKYLEMMKTLEYFKAQYEAANDDVRQTCAKIAELKKRFGVA